MNRTHVIDHLPILILSPHNRCNCRCIMCDIWKLDTVEEIHISELHRHAEDIARLGVRRVVFSGGEPFMHSDLFRLAEYLRSLEIRTTALSAGLLLAANARRITASLDEIIVSLDGPAETHDRIRRVPGAFELLKEGVRAIHELKPDFPVSARTTVQKANFSLLRRTVKTAMELGLRSVSFLAADLDSTAFNRPKGWPEARSTAIGLTEDEADRLEREIDGLIDEMPGFPGFVLETPEKLRRIVHHFRAHLGLVEPAAPRCNAPWVSAVLEADGTVRPCFFHGPIGTTRESSLSDVINSPSAVAFRRRLDISRDPVCRRCVCSLYRTV